jgi:hypothetical protein
MGASRQGFNLKIDLKNKDYKRFKINLLILLFLKRGKYERKLIIKDTFVTPFFKSMFGCNWFGHNWHYDNEDDYFICYKCFKHESPENRKSNSRQEKIDKILK